MKKYSEKNSQENARVLSTIIDLCFHDIKIILPKGKDNNNNRTKIQVKISRYTVLLFSSGSCERTKTYSIDAGFFFQSIFSSMKYFFALFLNILINKIKNMLRHFKMKRVLADIFLRKKK